VDVADDLGGGVDVAAGGEGGGEAAEGTEHDASVGRPARTARGPARTAGVGLEAGRSA
jgi:hypothetical protein